MASVFDVADFFLAKQNTDAGDTISNMKLQKLCYYAQGFCLAILGDPLFRDEIEAWKYGPVIPSLYNKYSSYGASSLPIPARTMEEIYKNFSHKQLNVLEEVYEVYGQYSAWRLSEFTHDEPTWRKHFDPQDTGLKEVIPQAEMKAYFLTQINNDN